MAFLTREEIASLGFASVGENVLISSKASFYGTSNIRIGSNVRIDDFCVLSAGQGGIILGNYIHIAVYSSLIGSETISVMDFSNVSSRVSIYSSNDDYTGEFMTNPMVPVEFTNVSKAPVIINKHVIIGSGSIVLPGVSLGTGVAIGAQSFVRRDCEDFNIYAGNPLRKIRARSMDLLELEKKIDLNQDNTIL